MPLEARAKLGVYIYALRDPRTKAVFYVGKGTGDRIYHHVWDALGEQQLINLADRSGAADHQASTVTKRARIRELYDAGMLPEHWVLRHGIPGHTDPHAEAYAFEQVAIGLATLAGQPLTNIAGGHIGTDHGMHPIKELIWRYAAPLAPPLPVPCAVIIVNAAADSAATREDIYGYARSSWRAGVRPRAVPNLPVFVVAGDLIWAVDRVTGWEPSEESKPRDRLWRYTAIRDTDLEATYVGTSLRAVRAARGGWRQHGWHPYL
jgi:hypothetical protein